MLTCVYMQVHFTRVNEVETSYELFRLNVKLSEVQHLLLRAIFHALISYLLFANLNFTGGCTQQFFTRRPEVQTLTFYIPFFTKKVPLSYTFYWQMVALSHTLFRTLHPFASIPFKCSVSSYNGNQSQKRNVFSPLESHKIHLLALLGPFVDPIENDRFPNPFIYFNEKIPSLSYTWAWWRYPPFGWSLPL